MPEIRQKPALEQVYAYLFDSAYMHLATALELNRCIHSVPLMNPPFLFHLHPLSLPFLLAIPRKSLSLLSGFRLANKPGIVHIGSSQIERGHTSTSVSLFLGALICFSQASSH
jgi:hypothetical protein